MTTTHYFRSLSRNPYSALGYPRRLHKSTRRKMLRWSALADVMEVRPLSLSRLQVLFTFFPKCFSNFRSGYLFAIGLPTLYLTLADTYLPIHTAFPSSATRLMPFHEAAVSGSTGYHRAWAQYSYERGLSSNGSALHIEFHQSANQPLIGVYATTQNH